MMNKDDICSVCIVEEWGLPVTGGCRRRCQEVCQKDGCCNSMPKKPENVCLVIDMEGFFCGRGVFASGAWLEKLYGRTW